MKKGFDIEPVYNKKYLKTRIKPCNNKINANFHGSKVPREESLCLRLSIIVINLVFKMG